MAKIFTDSSNTTFQRLLLTSSSMLLHVFLSKNWDARVYLFTAAIWRRVFFPYRISNLTAFNVMSHNAMSKSKLDMYQFFSKWKILSRNQKRWSRALFLISVVGGVSENAQFRREVAASAGADEKLRRAKRRENSNGLKHLCFDFLMILFIFKS